MSLPIKPELLLDKQEIGDQIGVISMDFGMIMIPERTHACTPVCSVYPSTVGLWNT